MPLVKARLGGPDATAEGRFVLGSVAEPIVLRPEADQHPGRLPMWVIATSSVSPGRKYLDRSSPTSDNGSWG